MRGLAGDLHPYWCSRTSAKQVISNFGVTEAGVYIDWCICQFFVAVLQDSEMDDGFN